MRRSHTILCVGLVTLVLAGCSAKPLTVNMSFTTTNPGRMADLSAAAMRVTQKRLLALGQKNVSDAVTIEGSTLHIAPSSAKIANDIIDQLEHSPFGLDIMEQVSGSGGDIVTEQFGSFNRTGITEKHLEWVKVGSSSTRGKGLVTLNFTPEGQKLLQDTFARLGGKVVGIFVRGVPMSLRKVAPNEKPLSLTIDGITSPELAQVFADDVNVGAFVRFSR